MVPPEDGNYHPEDGNFHPLGLTSQFSLDGDHDLSAFHHCLRQLAATR